MVLSRKGSALRNPIWTWRGRGRSYMKPKAKPARKHRGSTLNSFLDEEGIRPQAEQLATKRACAIQLARAIKESGLSKSEVARRMHTSRAVLDRLLDEGNP